MPRHIFRVQGYPADWTAEAEYEPKHVKHQGMLRDLQIHINPAVEQVRKFDRKFHRKLDGFPIEQEELEQMIQRSSLSDESKRTLASSVTVENIYNLWSEQ